MEFAHIYQESPTLAPKFSVFFPKKYIVQKCHDSSDLNLESEYAGNWNTIPSHGTNFGCRGVHSSLSEVSHVLHKVSFFSKGILCFIIWLYPRYEMESVYTGYRIATRFLSDNWEYASGSFTLIRSVTYRHRYSAFSKGIITLLIWLFSSIWNIIGIYGSWE